MINMDQDQDQNLPPTKVGAGRIQEFSKLVRISGVAKFAVRATNMRNPYL
jgi:hypothetical protein